MAVVVERSMHAVSQQNNLNRNTATALTADGDVPAISVLLLAVLCLGTFAAFWPALHGGFINWDDDKNIIDNLSYRGLGWTQLKWMWTTLYLGPYQPLTWMSFGLDYWIWGMNPFGYHLDNVLLHVANAAFVYFISLQLSGFALQGHQKTGRLSRSLSALVAAFLFAVHPLRVESVAWVTERKDVLSGMFYLATVVFYFKFCASMNLPTSRRYLKGALGCYLLSLLSKGMGVTLPIALLVLDVYPLKRLPANPMKWFGPKEWPVLREKIPFLAASLIFGVVGVLGQYHAGAVESLASLGLGARIALAFWGAVFYIWKMIAPADLLPLYSLYPGFNVWAPPILLSIGGTAAISVGLFKFRRRWPELSVAWAYYLVTLLPVSGIIQFGSQMAADRYTYLSCLPWAILAGAVAGRVLEKSSGYARFTLCVILGGTIAGLGVLTWRQSRIWHDSESFWGYILAEDPRCVIARDNLSHELTRLGLDFAREGEYAQALAELGQARAINPNDDQARKKFGMVSALDATARVRAGKTSEAVVEFRQALEIDPGNGQNWNNFGVALVREGQMTRAVDAFKEALKIDPGNTLAANNLRRIFSHSNSAPATAGSD